MPLPIVPGPKITLFLAAAPGPRTFPRGPYPLILIYLLTPVKFSVYKVFEMYLGTKDVGVNLG
jgi:hypothetical protein